ncbi:helix-turn-helix domain-containing protein [Winogradskyella flava]|uniref:AraC family transcriptional regulator n=1 Tax=Winogradskyella flava TaxID=1884876 RepID=A0A842IPD9_9FLAO|nr:helix-turn-helix domain-containing protein [Winogradskyella flava]MBC2843683.1 AraC family transcriptional regulator [Winogradskyella flava]
MSFSLFDILLIVIVSQGLFLAIVLQLIPKRNKTANNVLSVILLIASVICAGRVLAYKYNSFLILRIGTLIDGTIYLFGPLLYLYFRRLLFRDKEAYKLSFKHYILICLFGIYAVWTFTLSQDEIKTNLNNGDLRKLFLLIELTGLCSMLFYTYKLTQLTSTYKKYEQSQIAYNQNITNYIKRIIIAISIFISIWVFSFVSGYIFRYYHPLFNYNMMWLSISIFMYFIGFYSLTQPEIFRLPIKLTVRKAARDRMSERDIEDLKSKLIVAMNKENLYLKPNLSLSMLATYANTSSNNLSWYLNKIENKTFYRFINEHRINAFIKKVQNNEHQEKTLLALAFEVGFNTKSTFNKSFRTIVNDTPVNYIKNTISKNKSDSIQLVD